MKTDNGDALPPGYPIRERIEVDGQHYTAGQIAWMRDDYAKQLAEARTKIAALTGDLAAERIRANSLQVRINNCGLIPGDPLR